MNREEDLVIARDRVIETQNLYHEKHPFDSQGSLWAGCGTQRKSKVTSQRMRASFCERIGLPKSDKRKKPA
jgi:hypothetical protein